MPYPYAAELIEFLKASGKWDGTAAAEHDLEALVDDLRREHFVLDSAIRRHEIVLGWVERAADEHRERTIATACVAKQHVFSVLAELLEEHAAAA